MALGDLKKLQFIKKVQSSAIAWLGGRVIQLNCLLRKIAFNQAMALNCQKLWQ